WYYFGEPTPLGSNASIGINTTGVSGNVNFSAEGGFYQSPVQVILNSSSGNGIIRYTTDGSIPKSTSAQYVNPIAVNSNTVLRARVFENSKLPGKVTTNSYFINEARNLPVVSIVTNPALLWDRQLGIYLNSYKDREIPVSIEYFPFNSGRAFNLDAGAGIGGENIYRFAQKPFNIYLRSDYGQAHLNYKIFDDLPYKDYNELYLRNSGSDWTTTMFRDGMIVSVIKNKILNSLQDYRPAVMYLNGEYWGINNIREKVNDQFLIMHYNIAREDLDHIDESNNVLTGDSADYVNLLNFASANNLADSSNYNYVASKINVHDLMDFIIVQDYIANSSWGHNREMWRDKKNEKLWRWILVDMDRGFDAARITANQLSDIFNNFSFFRQLCNNNNFKHDFIQRYSEHLNHTFSNDRVVYIIDSIKSLIDNEMPRHIQKWGTLIDSLSIDGGFGKHGGIPSMTYWNQEVEKLKTFSAQRPAYAIQHLSNRFGLSGRANLKITSSVQNNAKLEINGFYETIGDSNLYFKNIPIPLKAYAPPGYRFKQWVESQNGNVIGTESAINYTISGDTELKMEFEKLGTGEVPEVLNSALTLYKTGSPYFIINDLNIGSNGVLSVEPGVVIYFSSNKSIYVKGKLLMEGTESEPITLLPYFAEEKWGAICFDKSNGTSEMNYVDISGSTNGNDTINFFAAVSSLESTVNLNHVYFNNVRLPISTQFSNMVIDNCMIENAAYVGDYVNGTGGNLSILNSVFIGNDIEDMDAVDIGSMIAVTEIRNNIFKDFTGSNSDGIDLGENSLNVVIENNLIMNCFDKGISIGRGSNALISYNAIAECGMGIGIKDSLSNGNIANCTFYKNNIGVDCFEKELNRGGGSAVIKNSVFANSSQAPFLIDDESRINISYSLSNTSALPGQGNLLVEPLMINPDGLNFHLQTGSPCIDKGDPQSPADNDGTRSDIGAYMYAGVSEPVVVINEINYNSISGFDPGDWIELCNAAKEAVDISGWVFMDENRTPSFVLNPGTVLQPDSYIVITKDLQLFNSLFPAVNNYAGDMSNGLSGGGEALYLYDTSGRLVDSLTYDNKSPWPKSPDGGGTTLELKNPGLENSLGTNWGASSGHGTPGAINSDYIAGVKDEQSNSIPKDFLLRQNYPNPFNPSTKISFEIPEYSIVHLTVYNILGKKVAEITKGEFLPGIYSIEWNGSSLASGIYLLKMNAQSTSGKNYSSVRKLVLLK
ncbi:MAG: CotH kinase family protein, partial [Ignavibacteria bacterium]